MRIDRLLEEDSVEGAEKRSGLRKIFHDLEEDYGGLGSEMNQWYRSSAVYTSDDGDGPPWPTDRRERAMRYVESSYPGFRVPHVWLMKRKTSSGPRPPLTSTRDLCGKGRFTLLTGVGGAAIWNPEVEKVNKDLDVDILVYSIGWGQEYEDTFFGWQDRRGVEQEGAVLVRPDLTVAWRYKSAGSEVAGKLLSVMKAVLSPKE